MFCRVLIWKLLLVASLAITFVATLGKGRILLWSVVAAARLSHAWHRVGAPHQRDAETDAQPMPEIKHPASAILQALRATAVFTLVRGNRSESDGRAKQEKRALRARGVKF